MSGKETGSAGSLQRADAIYARQSVDKKDSISIENQIERCEKEIGGVGTLVYVDRGFSGGSTNRPAFERLIKDVRQGRIQRVITYKLDRISRSVLDFQKMIVLFEEHGVEFVSVTEAFDTRSPMGRAMRNIMSVFAQLERETIQQRVTDSYYSLAEKGMFLGGRVPYAFRLKSAAWNGRMTSVYEAVPEKAELVRQMYQIYAEPAAVLGDVRRHLDSAADKVLLENRSWSTARIGDILKNPSYVRADADVFRFFSEQGTEIKNPIEDFTGRNGCYLYRGRDNREGGGKYDFRGRSLVVAPHEGIVEADIWLRCMRKLMQNRRQTSVNVKNSWLAGKIKCGNCGYAATVRKSQRKNGSVRYFVCTGKDYAVQCRGMGCTVRADELEDYMLWAIRDKLSQFDMLSADAQEAPNKNSRVINENKIRMTKLEQEIEGLIDKVALAGETVMERINRRVEALEKERRALALENASLEREGNASSHRTVTDHAENWPALSFADKRKVIDLLIDRIVLKDGTVKIVWKL